jgi:hypothetical protein
MESAQDKNARYSEACQRLLEDNAAIRKSDREFILGYLIAGAVLAGCYIAGKQEVYLFLAILFVLWCLLKTINTLEKIYIRINRDNVRRLLGM